MNLFSQVFKKNAQAAISRQGQAFFLRFSYDGQSASFREVLEHWPEIAALSQFVAAPDSKSGAPVRLNDLKSLILTMTALRARFNRQRRLTFDIPPEIERIDMRMAPPEGFRVRYLPANGKLRRVFSEGAFQLEDGWMRWNDVYWRYWKLTPALMESLSRAEIPAKDVPAFLSDDLPALRAAGIAAECPIQYDPTPALSLRLTGFSPNSLGLQAVWAADPHQVSAQFNAEGYVLLGDTLRPGISPAQLQKALGSLTGPRRLEGSAAAAFLDRQYPAWRPFFTGDLTAFEGVHRWVTPPFGWVLNVRAKALRGIGRAYGTPCVRVGETLFSPEDVCRMQDSPYTRVKEGWVRGSDLRALGLTTDALNTDSKLTKSIRVDADTLLHRGGRKLEPRFIGMEVQGAAWRDSGSKQTCATDHIAYLMHWGLCGGVVGGYEAAATYGLPELIGYLSNFSEGRALVLGSPGDIQGLKTLMPYLGRLDTGHLQMLSFGALISGKRAEADARWDLVMLVEPDVALKSASDGVVQTVAGLNAACRVAFFLNMPGEGDALAAKLLRCEKTPELLNILVRDGRHPEPLPEPYPFGAARGKAASAEKADEAASDKANSKATRAVPVPAKKGTSNLLEAFLADARRYVDLDEPEAEFAPFQSVMPRYADMGASQRRWYFHWRGRLREGTALPTDLAYIQLYSYELLNQVGVADAEAGYRALSGLWRRYRADHFALNSFMCRWMFDYIHVYPCGVTAADVLWDAPQLTTDALNGALAEMDASGAPLRLPVATLELLSQTKLIQSKFYQKQEDPSALFALVVDAVAAADAAWRAQNGKSLLAGHTVARGQTASVTAFADALAPHTPYTHPTRAYTGSARLREYLKQLLRYIENGLRARMKYGSKLQNIVLDGVSMAAVDECLAQAFRKEAAQSQTPAPQEAAAPRITLDLEHLNRLRQESDQVREALIGTGEEGAQPSSAGALDIPFLPTDGEAPPEALFEMEAVRRALSAVTDDEWATLALMRACGWRLTLRALQDSFPAAMPEVLVDGVNTAAVDALGDLLILREGDALSVAEDYRAALDAILSAQSPLGAGTGQPPEPSKEVDEPGLSNAESEPPAALTQGAWRARLDDLDDDWIAFFTRVAEAGQLEALGALTEGMAAFGAQARAMGAMPELLLDNLNEAAADALGDLIAGEDGLYEDYQDLLREHMSKE